MGQQTIEIRRTEPADYQAVQQIHAQPRAIWGTLQTPFPSAEVWRKRLTEHPENDYGLAACISGKVVGMLGLSIPSRSPRRRHVGEIGMAVHDDWQGQGVGTALMRAAVDLADRWLNLSRLELTVYTDNARAISLYEQFGFEIEGTLRRDSFRDGAYADAYVMARLV
ncbi:MAG: GNAT family N-acetyltransferase [Gammaproteobacteria bacterium]|nr:GNAT family N-acetyltransferase [Gammaproteobacteria bacterium]